MAALGHLFLIASLLVFLVATSSQTSTWNCPAVTGQHINVDEVLGKWYLLEVISAAPSVTPNQCAGNEITRVGEADEHHLLLSTFQKGLAGYSHHVNYSTIVDNSTGVWNHADADAESVVVDLTSDNEYLSLTSCFHGTGLEYTVILRRRPERDPVAIEEIHGRLQEAGVQNTATATLYNQNICAPEIENFGSLASNYL